MESYALIAENIRTQYGRNAILNDVSLHVEKGDIYGLIGKNGSGKSTLLRILTGLRQDFSGAVSIAKTNGRESRLAIVINDPSLFLNMSAFENLKVQAQLLDLHDGSQLEKVLRTVGLENTKNKPVRQYSLGMTQRLKLAMALLQDPDILFLDEPMNGLDPDGIADLRELILHLSEQGMTILISSHILSELEQVATRLGILHEGKIVKEIAVHSSMSLNGNSIEKLYMQYTRGGKANE